MRRKPGPFFALRTSTFRLTLMAATLFVCSSLILLAFLYMTITKDIQAETREFISTDLKGLIERYEQDGIVGLRQVVTRRSAARPDRSFIYLLLDGEGRFLAGNIDRWPAGAEQQDGWLRFTIEIPSRDAPQYHQAAAQVFTVPGGYLLLVGRDIEDRVSLVANIQRVILYGLGMTLLLSFIGGFVISRQLLNRVDAINRHLRQITAGDFSQRVPRGERPDEFDRLAGQLNRMLDRIEELLGAMRQVTDNIAHDLRTPLNRVKSRIEVALLDEPDRDETLEVMRETLRDADELIATFNALLQIASVEGASREGFVPCDVTQMLRDVGELYDALAEERGIRLQREVPDGLRLCGNRHLLAQAFANLLDNAVKYSPDGSQVRLRAVAARDHVRIEVGDHGPGIPAEARDLVLQRFVRLDDQRTTPGNGLGLSLVKAVCDLHKAELRFEDNRPGLRVTVRLPRDLRGTIAPQRRERAPARLERPNVPALPDAARQAAE